MCPGARVRAVGTLGIVLVGLAALLAAPAPAAAQRASQRIEGGLEGGVDWINTAGPIHLEDLRGKVVLLDFWTYCCINCHHILPDLEYLEKKYPNELVVIGVHTPKFDAERLTENIRKKVAEYRIKHPVVNDADQAIWSRFGVSSWPTLVVINARGEYVGAAPGEGNRAVLDQVIGRLVEEHRTRGELDTVPLQFFPESERLHTGPLLYPGKISADPEGKRLFITDTGHNRIVVTDLAGGHLATIGSGEAALKDGSFEEAAFHRPQGTRLHDGILYVADTENHAIRAIDFEAKTVRTVAGTGEQVYIRRGGGPARETGLNSPWDVLPVGPRSLALAMAGPHQIWTLDLEKEAVAVWAGTGAEDIQDGPIAEAAFAQPSGLARDEAFLYVADSEGSAVRAINIEPQRERDPEHRGPRVATIAGTHDLPRGQSLFAFGDVDGRGGQARLQHCLGLAAADGTLYVADTYNNKIKAIRLADRSVTTLAGTRSAGHTDDPPQFDEPGGLAVVGPDLYVADTNNHAIRVVERATGKVRTLALAGVAAPTPPRRAPRFPNPIAATLPEVAVAPGDRLTLAVRIELPEGFEINAEAPMPVLVETPDAHGALDPATAPAEGRKVEPPRAAFELPVRLAAGAEAGSTLTLRVSASSFECKKGAAGFCRARNFTWDVPIRFAEGGTDRVELVGEAKPAPAAAPAEPPAPERPRPRVRDRGEG